jgi:phosphonopyruvate decarboxylase
MPGVHDEPQHLKQGEITLSLLELLGIEYMVLGKDTSMGEVSAVFRERFLPAFGQGRSAAIVVQKGGLRVTESYVHEVAYTLSREHAIRLVLERAGQSDAVVSTTGKISREVYEQREMMGEGHAKDFLTVGSMGHASMIALQIAEQRPRRHVWCLDGDGAMLMHAGALALIGARGPKNLIHVLLNNCAHESVGGLPTVANSVDFTAVAHACGYAANYRVKDEVALVQTLGALTLNEGPVLLEIDVSNSSRADLGRPKTSPVQNKLDFMNFLRDER